MDPHLIQPTVTREIVIATTGPTAAESDRSCAWPVMFLFACALVWLLLGSIAALIVSVKMHAPQAMAGAAALGFGRLKPVATDIFLYGFASQAAFGVLLWLICRIGRTLLAGSGLIIAGGVFWNLGVVLGLLGLLVGEGTGQEWLEFPRYASPILFVALLLIAGCAVVTFHSRTERGSAVPLWFVLAALFWFPWIYSTANLLLVFHPARGVLQASIDYWFIHNFMLLWLGSSALAILFHFIPLFKNRPLHSYYLALFGFWLWVFFASAVGIPSGAPLPAWIGSLSTVASVLLLIPTTAIALNLKRTLSGSGGPEALPMSFFRFAAVCFVTFVVIQAITSLPMVNEFTEYTHLSTASQQLLLYGLVAMSLFGAIYHIVPLLSGEVWPAGNPRLQFFCSGLGMILIGFGFGFGGVLQGVALANSRLTFIDTVRRTIPFIGIATLGSLSLLVAHSVLLRNFLVISARCCRACCFGAASCKEARP